MSLTDHMSFTHHIHSLIHWSHVIHSSNDHMSSTDHMSFTHHIHSLIHWSHVIHSSNDHMSSTDHMPLNHHIHSLIHWSHVIHSSMSFTHHTSSTEDMSSTEAQLPMVAISANLEFPTMLNWQGRVTVRANPRGIFKVVLFDFLMGIGVPPTLLGNPKQKKYHNSF